MNIWKKNKESWCENSHAAANHPNDLPPASITCYPYHQAHKKLDGRPADVFCEGRNILIDFRKVSGGIVASGKPPKGGQYLNFDKESTFANCAKTKAYKSNLFMPHHRKQVIFRYVVCVYDLLWKL